MEPEYHLASWEEFRPLIEKIRTEYGWHKYSDDFISRKTVLFRGHDSLVPEIQTTLERYSKERFSVYKYCHYVHLCSFELESLTGKKWNLDLKKIEEDLRTKKDSAFAWLPCYDYIVYLRHHGFPSPLLDWTESAYIAAYFAYREKSESERVEVLSYIEMPNSVKSMDHYGPKITLHGPFVSTHKRHFVQKAWYTIATQYDKDSEENVFCSHEDIFRQRRNDQDILIRITLPSLQRKDALKELDDYNINEYTIFQTEDALVKAMAIKHFELD